MDDFEREIKSDFLLEAKDLLSNTEQCFLNLERCSDDPDNINNLFRLAHNLKGSSGAVGFTELAEFTHRLESLLLALKEKKIPVTKSIVDLLLRSNDYLTETIDLLQENLEANYQNPKLSEELLLAMEADYGDRGEKEPIIEPDSSPGLTMSSSATAPPKSKDENIRVSLSRIDQLLNNVGELVILQAMMNQQSLESSTVLPAHMRKALSAMSKIVKETQEVAMGLRMIPIRQTFQKMHRIVRDTSQAIGKEVEFHLSGEETEVDKTVLEQIGDPLVHIIRNAVDHGLESSEERVQVGKPKAGQVFLSAFHKAGHVVIEIRDDGKGLDGEKLVAKAKAKGLISQDATLPPDKAHQLIFLPGFSTKEEVTDVSGRGVGMDVVKTNIGQLQGEIEIDTELGKGTCFRILLPLTLAIVDGIVVRLDDERYVIPLSQINEFFRAKKEDINSVYGRAELLTLRGETLPVYHLNLLIRKDQKEKIESWNLTALIARDSNKKAFAVMVDEVISQQQIVIKPLGQELQGKLGMMGSAILADGKPALILDLFELTKSLREKDHYKSHKSSKKSEMEAA